MARPHALTALLIVPAFASGPLLTGCDDLGCIRGNEDECIVPSPCQELSYNCDNQSVSMQVVDDVADLPGGPDALGAVGDIILRNSRVVAVIEALDNANYFSPSGGMLTDLATVGGDNDSIAHLEGVTGLLPGDAVVYERMELLDGGAGFRAVQFKGHLAGDERMRVYTRYEIRSCEPGIRVRTEMVNKADEDAVWSVSDGFYWSSRSSMPFTPEFGAGFEHPAFSLGSVNGIMSQVPLMASSSDVDPPASYALVGCNLDMVEGFQSGEVSVMGTPRRIVPPRDYEIYERFIGVAAGKGVAPGMNVALEVRRQLHDEDYVRVSGTVVLEGGRDTRGDRARAAVHIDEGQGALPDDLRRPWTTTYPDEQGRFSALVPANRDYVVEVRAFGRIATSRDFRVGLTNLDLGELEVDASGTLSLGVTLDGLTTEGTVFVVPAGNNTRQETQAYWNRHETGNQLCAPLLGAPYGGSPACNRVIVTNAGVDVEIPPGTYDLFATVGPFATIGRTRVEVFATEARTATFDLVSLPILPPGVLSADFHVHGGKSFDTNLPDIDRVLSFLAARIDVVAATDHDAIWDYAQAIDELGVRGRFRLMVGLETTGHTLWNFNPEVLYPQVIGHYNFWPLDFTPGEPRFGAPYDELAEPGLLFARMASAGLDSDGVIQLNHPWTPAIIGRDLGFPRALGINLTDPLPEFDDGTAAGVFIREPAGAGFRNVDHHTQEVMNGTRNGDFFGYRAFWFYLLNQGYLRAGTANSDSHTLTDNVLGTPRTLVWTQTTMEAFNERVFNADVRSGHMVGTNGPLIVATVTGADGIDHRPGLESFPIDRDSDLHVSVSAAPWVPVDEVRVYVNGKLAANVIDGVKRPSDALGTDDLVRYDGTFSLLELLPGGSSDAWIVVEAGELLPTVGDLDCDGAPDTSDNNKDNSVDWMDVDRDGDGDVDDDDRDTNGDGRVDDGDVVPACTGPTGPVTPLKDRGPADAGYEFSVVTPGAFSVAFTNPFILDRDGETGFSPPGL